MVDRLQQQKAVESSSPAAAATVIAILPSENISGCVVFGFSEVAPSSSSSSSSSTWEAIKEKVKVLSR